MKDNYIIALDVGGTSIKSALVSSVGTLWVDTICSHPSLSHKSREVILDHLFNILKKQSEIVVKLGGMIRGIAFAFPGPFDYERGISQIYGLDKFDPIFGVSLRDELAWRIKKDPLTSSLIAPGFEMVFINDAHAFALGQWFREQAVPGERSICVTLGTGLGSSFLEDGKIVTNRPDVPPNGWIYCTPFRAGIVEDYISKRGILAIATELGFQMKYKDVKDLAEMALNGMAKAQEIFIRFGSALASALAPFIKNFQPHAVVIGGQIAKSFDLYANEVKKDSAWQRIRIVPVADTSACAFIGASKSLLDPS